MKTYIKRFKSGKISHYLRPCKIITGQWGIETRNYNKKDFVININYPFFDNEQQADEYLSIVIKEVYCMNRTLMRHRPRRAKGGRKEKEMEKREIIRTSTGIVRVVREWEDYDSELCHDGGDYYQPYFTATCPRRGEVLTIDDTSCGDFGSRVDVTLYRRGREVASAKFGSMLQDYQEWSDFILRSPSHRFWVGIAEQLGYRIPVDAGC